MLILYDLSTYDIIGVSAILCNNGSDETEPTLKGCFPDYKIVPNVSAVTVQDNARIANELYKYELKFNRLGEPLGLDLKMPKPYIELTTDIAGKNNDSVPDLKADGRSKARITAYVRDHTGELLINGVGEIVFKTTGGRLKKKIVKTKNGVAKTQLQSVKETKTITITATANGCSDGKLDLDFV
jgi:hypothetical protein